MVCFGVFRLLLIVATQTQTKNTLRCIVICLCKVCDSQVANNSQNKVNLNNLRKTWVSKHFYNERHKAANLKSQIRRVLSKLGEVVFIYTR